MALSKEYLQCASTDISGASLLLSREETNKKKRCLVKYTNTPTLQRVNVFHRRVAYSSIHADLPGNTSSTLSSSSKTRKTAVFAGSMQLLAGIKLCTGRVLTNHPHYEDRALRERTRQVKQILYPLSYFNT